MSPLDHLVGSERLTVQTDAPALALTAAFYQYVLDRGNELIIQGRDRQHAVARASAEGLANVVAAFVSTMCAVMGNDMKTPTKRVCRVLIQYTHSVAETIITSGRVNAYRNTVHENISNSEVSADQLLDEFVARTRR